MSKKPHKLNYVNKPPHKGLPIDLSLLSMLLLLCAAGLFILYSAANQNIHVVESQFIRIIIAFVLLFVFAYIHPNSYRRWTPWFYIVTVLLLLTVLAIGHIGKGAQRWLSLGLFRFQPSELMKLAIPMTLAWYFSEKHLPPKTRYIIVALMIIFIPALLIAKQPDLGTALLIIICGMGVLFLAGMSWRLILTACSLAVLCLPVVWYFMRDYQRQRVLTFFNPERDPLGSGYHIIQSKIAIGSGGIFGKGWLNGTQSHLAFLPEHATDFIFAVCGEELGLIGCLIIFSLYLLISVRCFYISYHAQDTYTRLLAGGLGFMFFISAFINMGMVSGILPVVGLPLPLISYGGTSVVTLLAGFGILMSIHKHKKLLSN